MAKKNEIEPTTKMKKYLAGRLQGKSKKTAALEADYAPSSANTAKTAIESKKGWEMLLNTGNLNDNKLIKIHNELLGSKDQRTKENALKLAYQVKGRLKHNISFEKSDSEGYSGLD